MKTEKSRKVIGIAVLLILVVGIFALPALAAKENDDTGNAWNIYFRPGFRFGSDDRILFILDFLVPLYQDDKNIVFTNIKFTPNLSDLTGWEVNLGMGYRRLFWDDKLIVGINAYYDQRQTDWGTNFDQWGIGLEAMADIPLKSFDLGLTARINYYHPFSNIKYYGMGSEYANYFLSNTAILFDSGRVEEPMRGIDYEAGMRIPYLSDYAETWVYAGGYNYFGREVDNVNGFRARLEVIPTDFIKLNYEFSHDNYNGDEHYGEITFELPFSIGNLVTGKDPFEGLGDMFKGSRDIKERMVEPTRRDVDVKVIVDNENKNVEGVGNMLEEVVFVSETGNNSTGNGTKERPYRSIRYAMNNDLRILNGTAKTIHVMNSSSTNFARGGRINVADFLIWGSGVNHPKYPVINMPYSGHPTVRSPSGINYVLTLAQSNITVTGLEINKTGGVGATPRGGGIRINDFGNSGAKITENIFNINRPGTVYGIYSNINNPLGTASNPIIIANNSFSVRSGGNDAAGIFLEVFGANNNIFATITGNDMSNTIWGGDNALGILLYSDSGGIGSETRPVIISGNPMTVTANTLSANGIVLDADLDIFATITGNDMSNTITGGMFADGIYLYSDSGGIGSETRPVIISGNPMTVTGGTVAYGIFLDADDDLFATITGNDMSNTITGGMFADGICLYSHSGGIGSETSPVIISGNPMTVTANTFNAYGIILDADLDIFAKISNNATMNITAISGTAWGAYLLAGGLIGNNTTHTLFQNNSGTIDGATARYMLWLEDVVAGSYVDWTGSSFNALGGGGLWSGNHPGLNGPVDTNNYGGTITP